jgi:hypothetical protein
MNTYNFKRGNEFKKVIASSSEIAQKITGYRFSLFSITKPSKEGYHGLTINQRINVKGNAGLLYTSYDQKFFNMTERPSEARLILKRISKRNPDMFTPSLLLNKNLISI